MVKTRFTLTDTERLSRFGTKDSDGKEIPTSLMYDQVMPAARNLQQDCSLETIIDGVDRE